MTAYTAHFAGLHDVLEWIKKYSFIYYQAPLDARPYSVRIERYTIDNTKLDYRANGPYPRAYQFTIIDGVACVTVEDCMQVLYSSSEGWKDAGRREIADRA